MKSRPLIVAGFILGIGMGGFLDGILFHQVLQLHSMLSAKLPQDSLVNVKASMFWDGVFHFFTWITTLVGIWLFWRAAKAPDVILSGYVVIGGMLSGWGTFNIVEGIIDHYIFGIHHVVENAGLSFYDVLFVVAGLILNAVGWVLIITASRKKVRASHEK